MIDEIQRNEAGGRRVSSHFEGRTGLQHFVLFNKADAAREKIRSVKRSAFDEVKELAVVKHVEFGERKKILLICTPH